MLGVAVPHARLEGLRQPLAAYLRTLKPILYDTPDTMVQHMFILLAPDKADDTHLQILSIMSRILTDSDFIQDASSLYRPDDLFGSGAGMGERQPPQQHQGSSRYRLTTMPQRGVKPHVLVVGGGHAGVEAAAAAARIGTSVTLVTHSLDAIGQLSCNPAVGGIGKSQLVREIDALDGLIGRAADLAGIHYRILNSSKGPAVRATRAQTDRTRYRTAIRSLLEAHIDITLFQGEVVDLIIDGGRIRAAQLAQGASIKCDALILTAGTFLAARMHTGTRSTTGGRAGSPAAQRLAAVLRDLDLPVGRLKTGTPPRLDGRTIDYAAMTVQASENPLPTFSLFGPPLHRPRQVACHLTATTEESHAIVRAALPQSPVVSGAITGPGPRYCPSIEDKVVRFADRSAHKIFLEPEGLDTSEVYPNGISTALPFDAQVALVHSIPGLHQARLTRVGYAVEYDYYDPRSLAPTLAVSAIDGLFFAGQINGTTGYEEAAAQGLLAGTNAALQILGRAPWWPGREEAYLGVLTDDLTTQGVSEPYRMFTSRAEFRLRLREDNADLRLTPKGYELGLVSEKRWQVFETHRELVEGETERLQRLPTTGLGLEGGDVPGQRATTWLRRPAASYAQLRAAGAAAVTEPRVLAEIEARCKYAGLIERQDNAVHRQQRLAELRLPPDLDFSGVHGLSTEAREKLRQHRPATLGQAARISGITTSAVALLQIHLAKKHRRA